MWEEDNLLRSVTLRQCYHSSTNHPPRMQQWNDWIPSWGFPFEKINNQVYLTESDPHSTVKQGRLSQSGENGKGSQASGWHPWAQGAGECAAFCDGKMTDILRSRSWGTSRDIIHEQKAPKSLLGSSLVLQAGILQVSQEARNSILQRKGDCHYSVLTATILDSQDVAKVKQDALGNNKYDNRAPGKISTECWHWWWKR